MSSLLRVGIVLLFMTTNAFAGTMSTSVSQVINNGSGVCVANPSPSSAPTGETPGDLCTNAWNVSGQGSCNSGLSSACVWKRSGSTLIIGWGKYTASPTEYATASVEISTSTTGLTTCWKANLSSISTSFTNDVPVGCEICPEGQEFNATNGQCEAPECDEGEVFDEEISACRVACESDEVYLYSRGVCEPQCEVGKTASHGFLWYRKPQVDGEIFTVNGCPAQARVQCQPDTEGVIGEIFGPEHVTGEMCAVRFVYTEEVQQTVEFQTVYEDELSGNFGYQGEGTTEAALDGEIEPVTDAQWHVLNPALEAFDSANWKYVCQNGTAAWIYTVDGVEGQIEIVGGCTPDDESVDPVAGGGGAIGAQVQAIAEAQGDQGDILQAINDAISAMTSGDTILSIDWGIFTAPSTEPTYERQYENLGDAVGEEDGSDAALEDALNSAVPDFSAITAPACFSWEFPATAITGPFLFEPPCAVWDWLHAFVMATAAFIAWRIIFVRE